MFISGVFAVSRARHIDIIPIINQSRRESIKLDSTLSGALIWTLLSLILRLSGLFRSIYFNWFCFYMHSSMLYSFVNKNVLKPSSFVFHVSERVLADFQSLESVLVILYSRVLYFSVYQK